MCNKKTMHYSIEPRDQTFLKGYRLLSLTKDTSKNIGKI